MGPLFCHVLGSKHTKGLLAVRIAAKAIPSLALLFTLNTLLNSSPGEELLSTKEKLHKSKPASDL